MKLTVLRNNQKMALEHGSPGGELRRVDTRGRCGAGLLCVFGLLLGFVVSQLVVGYCSQDIYNGDTVELVWIPEASVQQRDQRYGRVDQGLRSLRSPWMSDIPWVSDPENNLGDSILMAAMLNIVQQNLLEEITQEGFIIVEGHADELPRSVETIGDGMPRSVDFDLQTGLDQVVQSFESIMFLSETIDTGLVYQQQPKPSRISIESLYQNTPYIDQPMEPRQNIDGAFSQFEKDELNELTGNDQFSLDTPPKASEAVADSSDRDAEDLELLRKYLDVPDFDSAASSAAQTEDVSEAEIAGAQRTNDGSQDESYDDLQKVLEYLDVPDLPATSDVV